MTAKAGPHERAALRDGRKVRCVEEAWPRQEDVREGSRLMTSNQIAWAAGVYEGEGCATAPTRTNRTETVQITQKDPWLLYELQRLFGGTVRFNSRAEGVYGRWSLFGPAARGFLMTVYSFCSPRRRERIREVLQGRTDYVRGPYRARRA